MTGAETAVPATRGRVGRTKAAREQEVRKGFAYLHGADPVLARLIDARPGYDPDAWLRTLPKLDLFGGLLLQITGQQISVAATRAILGRVTARFGGRFPTPAQLLGLSVEDLRADGLSRRKAATMLDLAERFVDGRLSARRLSHLPDQAVIDELTQVSGIGTWTVHGALLVALHRPDVVPTGDLALRHAVQRVYGLDHLPGEDDFRALARRWSPYGSLAVNLLFAEELDPT